MSAALAGNVEYLEPVLSAAYLCLGGALEPWPVRRGFFLGIKPLEELLNGKVDVGWPRNDVAKGWRVYPITNSDNPRLIWNFSKNSSNLVHQDLP